MTLAEKVGELLTEARGDTPRRALARQLDLSPTTLVNVEQGKENLTLARLERLAAGYGVVIDVTACATEVAERRTAVELDAAVRTKDDDRLDAGMRAARRIASSR